MTYSDWLPLLWLSARDPKVISALAANGFDKPITFRPDESTASVDFKAHGMSVGFTSEFLLKGGASDLPILSTVVMKPLLGKSARGWTAYRAPLPHGLSASHTRDDVSAVLGTPANLDEDFCSALWEVDGLEIGILFTEDWKQIKQLGVSLPGAI